MGKAKKVARFAEALRGSETFGAASTQMEFKAGEGNAAFKSECRCWEEGCEG